MAVQNSVSYTHLDVYKRQPVLLQKSVDDLVTNPEGIYVDVTFGGGGHSREILNRLSDKGKLFSFCLLYTSRCV